MPVPIKYVTQEEFNRIWGEIPPAARYGRASQADLGIPEVWDPFGAVYVQVRCGVDEGVG